MCSPFHPCISSTQSMFKCLNVSSRLSVQCFTLALVPPCCEEQSCSGDVMLLHLIIQYHKNPVSKGNRRHVVEVMHFSLQIERGGDSQQQWSCNVLLKHRGWKTLPPAGYIWVTQKISFSGDSLVL